MGSTFLLDHLVIAVSDLQQASADYQALGFNVVVGGQHQHAPTQNALVYFADGTYLELIEWTAPAPGEKWYEQLTRQGEGLVDFAFVPSDIGAAIAQAETRGVVYRGPIDGSRIKPSGEHVRWQLGWPAFHGLPFLCGDITPRALRVPEGAVREHPNQALGITSIAIRVDDLEVAVDAYQALVGADSEASWRERHSLPDQGLEVVSIPLGQTQLHLVAAAVAEDSTAAQAFRHALRTQGQGVYRLCISATAAEVPTELCHGASLRLASRPVPLLDQVSESGQR